MHAYWRHVLSVVSAAGLILLLCSPASSKGDCAAEFNPEATKIIGRMNDFLTRTKQFSATVDLGYDIVQESGQKIEFGETRTMTVRRPDRARVDATDRDGSQTGIVFDGTTISVFDMKDKVYAVAEKPGSLEDMITYFMQVLGMRLPMGILLQGHVPEMLKQWARDVDYVASETMNGVPCDHVAVRGDREDLQLWIARGDQPLLQRMMITYTRAEGQPQFWAQVRKWDLSPDVADSIFVFTSPAGFAQIPFKPRGVAARSAGDVKAGQP